jgi:FkbM family methyltransferase
MLKLWLKAKISAFFHGYLGDGCKAFLVETQNGRLLLPSSDLSLTRSLSKAGVYNKPLLDTLLSLAKKDGRVLFVGTHVGSLLIPMAKNCQSVTGIEANPNTFKLLEINVVLNDVKNATLHNIAAWDSDTQLEFLASKDNTGGSKVQPKSKDRFEFTYDTPTVISVPAKKLDEVLEGQTFGLVVMDIEGSEWRALKGMPTLMKNVSKLVLEILPNHLENVAGVSPADFFSALPAHFTSARPINVPEMKEHYSKNDFLAMYAAVVKHHFMDGIDVIFSA